jgi:hypothetical protein
MRKRAAAAGMFIGKIEEGEFRCNPNPQILCQASQVYGNESQSEERFAELVLNPDAVTAQPRAAGEAKSSADRVKQLVGLLPAAEGRRSIVEPLVDLL